MGTTICGKKTKKCIGEKSYTRSIFNQSDLNDLKESTKMEALRIAQNSATAWIDSISCKNSCMVKLYGNELSNIPSETYVKVIPPISGRENPKIVKAKVTLNVWVNCINLTISST